MSRSSVTHGSTNPTPVQDFPRTRLAFKIGRLLADHGFVVITGGMGGVMCVSACNFGSDAILVVSGSHGPDETRFEQVELSAAVHLALYKLELGDLAFGLAIGPGRGDRHADGGLIFQDARGE